MSDKEKTKWIVGLVVTISLAVISLLFAVTQTLSAQEQAANTKSHEYLINRIDESDRVTSTFVLEFKTDISAMKRDLQYIIKALDGK